MATLRFNHVFIFLLLIGVLSSLVLPGGFGDRFKQIDLIFAPVSKPTRYFAVSVSSHFASKPKPPTDGQNHPLTIEEAVRQLEAAQSELSNVSLQLEELKKREQERNQLGDARKFCDPFEVIGGDAGNRQSLSIEAEGESHASHLATGMAVLFGRGLVGRIASEGVGSARVQLVTDVDFHVTATFARWTRVAADSQTSQGEHYKLFALHAPPVSVSGDGRGKMRILQLRLDQVKEYGLAAGDLVVLNDLDGWPAAAQGEVLGNIDSIIPDPRQPLFADITVAPRADLLKLPEVMVMDKATR